MCVLVLSSTCLFGQARQPVVAGTFYPGNAKQLESQVDSLLELVPDILSTGRPVALVSPHAGYIYSGETAAYGYSLLRGLSYSTVILIGPSHRIAFDGCAVYDKGSWRTPLGQVEIDSKVASRLCTDSDKIFAGRSEHRQEHSLEVQLPFLQRVLADFKIVPVEMGNQSEENIKALADALSGILKDRDDVLLVASTDLSHYYPRSQAKKLDSYCISFINAIDGYGLVSGLRSQKAQMCGGGPTASLLMACEKNGVTGVEVLKYDDSGTSSGDVTAVVGYVSAVLYKEEEVGDKKSEPRKDEYLNRKQQETLLSIARESIRAAVEHLAVPERDVPEGILTESGAAFVTITIGGNLRGCIGYTEAIMPLSECVSECAISAAMRDPRFRPLTTDEFRHIDIEISVLTPLVDIESIDEIEVGRDGLMISKMGRRGLLLPQVATDYNWDRETFLINTCRKAGLPDDAWETGARIQKFTAFVFHE